MARAGLFTGELIPGSECPECAEPLEYNGNYWCSVCPWILMEDDDIIGITRREKDAFNLAYLRLMRQRGRTHEIDLDALL